jgi:hypothetical protein
LRWKLKLFRHFFQATGGSVSRISLPCRNVRKHPKKVNTHQDVQA